MAKWEQYLESDEQKKVIAKKPNKNFFCRKNRIGNGKFGQHEYNDNICTLCGHIKKNQNKVD